MCAVPSVQATVIVLYDSAVLAEKSDAIVVGRVTGRSSAWEGERIVTRVTVLVERTIKGGSAKELTISADGGTVNGVTMKTIGSAEFAVNDRSLLFLRKRMGNELVVTGLAQGKLDVMRSRDGVDRIRWIPPRASAPRAAELDYVIGQLAGAERAK